MRVPDPGLMYRVNEEGTLKEYFDLIINVAGRGRSPFVKIPRWVAVFSGYRYQMLARINGKPSTISSSWVRVGSHYSWWDCSMAREQLGLGQLKGASYRRRIFKASGQNKKKLAYKTPPFLV